MAKPKLRQVVSMKAIDCHVHLNSYNDSKGSIDDSLVELLQSMDGCDIDASIVISSYKVNKDRPSTDKIIGITEKHDNLAVVGGYSIENHTIEDFRNYRKWLLENKLKGIKIYCGYEHYFPTDKKYQKIYDLCTEFEVPLMVHCGDTFASNAKLKYAHPLNVDEVATDNPELKIVICHLGNPWILDCQEVLYKNRNVYADISGLFFGPVSDYYEQCLITKIKELLGYTSSPHHLLFGSDWPISDVRLCIRLVNKLGLSRKDYDLLMFGNTQKIFKV
jgi:predicted TIM-barrel fold metal-dependent hydrolase